MFHRFRTTRARLGLIIVVVFVAALAVAGIAYATSSSLSPETQTVHSGNTVTWNTTWSGTPPFDVTFYYDTGQTTDHTSLHTSSTSHTFNWAFYDCTDTTHYQQLQVTDSLGLQATASSQVVVIHGNIC